MDLFAVLKDNLVPFLAVLTVLVFVHEMGHYLIARWNGVRVEVFSVGFGPELFGRTDRSGTRWRLSAIPLGGYVKMFGDADPSSLRAMGQDQLTEEERAVAFHHKRLRQRTAVVAAGPAANFLFAIVLLAGLNSFVGERQITTAIDSVVPDSPAADAGLAAGDLIIEVDGVAVDRFEELQSMVMASPGRTLSLVVDRGGSLISLAVTPRAAAGEAAGAPATGVIGVRGQQSRLVRLGPLDALWRGTVETATLTRDILVALGEMLTGRRGADDLGGPLRIAQMSSQVVEMGWTSVTWFTAVLSINLGLINLFPVPLLDGGHLVFYSIEAVRGRPVGMNVQIWASMSGLAFIIGLMLFLTWNDLVQMQVLQVFGSLFG